MSQSLPAVDGSVSPAESRLSQGGLPFPEKSRNRTANPPRLEAAAADADVSLAESPSSMASSLEAGDASESQILRLGERGRQPEDCEGQLARVWEFLEAAESLPQREQLPWLQRALESAHRAILRAPEDELVGCRALRGYVHLRLGDFPRAIDDCTAACREDSSEPEPWVWRGIARAAEQQWSSSVADLNEAIRRAGGRVAEFIAIRERVVDDALRRFQVVTREGRADAGLFLERGGLYEGLREWDRARRDFLQAVELASEPDAAGLDAAARLGAARALLALGEHSPALEILRPLLFESLDDASEGERAGEGAGVGVSGRSRRARCEALAIAAQVHQARGDAYLAHEVLAELRRSESDRSEARLACGELALQLGDLPAAIDELTAALKRRRRAIKPRELRAQAYIRARNFGLAIRDLDLLLHRDSDQPAWWLWRGESHAARADWEHARRDFEQALRLDDVQARTYFGLARVAEAAGQWEEAVFRCEQARRLDPRLSAAGLLSGRLRITLGRLRDACQDFTEVIEQSPAADEVADAYYRRGIALYRRRRRKAALEDLEEAIRRRPWHAGTRVWRSHLLADAERWGEALSELQVAIELSPNNAEAYRQIGEDIARSAISSTEAALAEAPSDGQAWHTRALAAAFLGDAETANRAYLEAIPLTPHDRKLVLDHVRQLLHEDSLAEASTRLDRFLETDPQAWEVRRFRGRLRLRCGQTAAAFDDLRMILQEREQDAEAHLDLAELYLQTKRWPRARLELERALRLDTASWRGYALRGRLELVQDEPLAAIADLTRSLELAPDQPELLVARGHAFLKHHQHVEALGDFEQALSRRHDLLEAYTGRAIVLVKRGDPEAALIWLTKALRRFERPAQWANLLINRARVYFNMSCFEQAIQDYSTVLAWPLELATETVACYARGIAWLQLGEPEKARADFQRTLELDPGYRPAQVACDWLAGRVTQRPKALQPPKHAVPVSQPPQNWEARQHAPEPQAWEVQSPFDQWLVRTPDRQEFGPVPKSLLDRWYREGRIGRSARLLRADWERWRRATVVYASLGGESAEPAVHEDAGLAEPAIESLPSQREAASEPELPETSAPWRTQIAGDVESERPAQADAVDDEVEEDSTAEDEGQGGSLLASDFSHFESLDQFLTGTSPPHAAGAEELADSSPSTPQETGQDESDQPSASDRLPSDDERPS